MSEEPAAEELNEEPVEIGEHVKAICEALGLEPGRVGKLVLFPTAAEADYYLVNESGAKYVDEETAQPATETRRFRVSTFGAA